MEEDHDATKLMEQIGGVQRQQILSVAGKKGDTPAVAVLIYGMNAEVN